jgi:hypothetical protein
MKRASGTSGSSITVTNVPAEWGCNAYVERMEAEIELYAPGFRELIRGSQTCTARVSSSTWTEPRERRDQRRDRKAAPAVRVSSHAGIGRPETPIKNPPRD